MKTYSFLFNLYQSFIFFLVQMLILLYFLIYLSSALSKGYPYIVSNKLISFFLIFLIIEIFFRFKIARISPKISVSENTGDIYASFTLKALDALGKKIIHDPSLDFILSKSNIARKEVPIINIAKGELANASFSLTKELGGKFVTVMDVFGAFLLLIEPQTKLLFSKKIKREEFLNILKWARSEFPKEEVAEPIRASFRGEGIGEALTSGWTLETKKYTRDLTAHSLLQKPLLTGRSTEYQELVEALAKSENNNVLLIGESGVGKDALVEALAYNSFSNNVPNNLKNKRILELMLGSLISGTVNQQDLETRLQAIIDEVIHAGNIILFIPQFQTIASPGQNNLNITAILAPYLKMGELPIIATITPIFYKQLIEGQPLSDLFSIVKLEEPDQNTACEMLFAKAASIEKQNKVLISFKAIIAAVSYANTYAQDKFLPGSAVFLLQDSAKSVVIAGKKIVLEEDVLAKIQEKTKIAVEAPSTEEKDLLLHLEDKLHQRIVDQEEAVSAISEVLRRLRTGIGSKNKPISFLFLGPTGVGKTETAKALASVYFGGQDHLVRLDMSEYSDESGVKRLLGALPGEGDERGELTDKIHDHPFSLVLLDEFEKAHFKILDLFLQVLDDGRLTDNKGKTVSFNSAIIIATSNAASEFIRESVIKRVAVDKAFQESLLEFLQTKGLFKPELLNRFDEIIVFKPLGEKEVWEITKLLLNSVTQKLAQQDITVNFDEKIIQKIVREGFDQQFGARPLRRFIQDTIEDTIAQKILKGEIQRGNKINVSVNADNSMQITML